MQLHILQRIARMEHVNMRPVLLNPQALTAPLLVCCCCLWVAAAQGLTELTAPAAQMVSLAAAAAKPE